MDARILQRRTSLSRTYRTLFFFFFSNHRQLVVAEPLTEGIAVDVPGSEKPTPNVGLEPTTLRLRVSCSTD